MSTKKIMYLCLCLNEKERQLAYHWEKKKNIG